MHKNHRSIQILHLEDSALDAELVRDTLHNAGIGCTITRITNRNDLESALENKPDMVLSDSQLPEFDTLEALEMVRERWPDLPFVFLSGSRASDARKTAMEKGATAYIPKANLPELATCITTIREAEGKRIPQLPKPGIMVIAQCKDFRCLAFIDSHGVWRDYHSRQPLPEVLNWQEV